MERVLITGGAGFIGSHLVDLLIQDYDIVVLDDLSSGALSNINQHIEKENFTFIQGSILNESDIEKALHKIDTVFHFAAQPDVRLSISKPLWDFQINVTGSILLLDKIRQNDIKRLIFASSGGTVYGETDVFPTLEKTAFRPISNYGAAKGAMEMYMSSYAELYGLNSVSMRLGNVIGPRLTHGVIFDFYNKLCKTPERLEVLGDGQQEKSYIYVGDAVNAAHILSEHMKSGFTPINVASGERLMVSRIAELVIEEMDLHDTRIEYTGGNRGWRGDVEQTDISIALLESCGWKLQVSIEEGVRRTVKWLRNEYQRK